MARVGESFRRQLQPLLDCVKNGAATGMNGPEVDGMNIGALCNLIACGGEPSTEFAWNLAGKVHVETLFADAPGDQWMGVRENDGEKAVNGEAHRLRTDQISGAAIREDQ